MTESILERPHLPQTRPLMTGPATLAQVMEEMEVLEQAQGAAHYRPLPTGFQPLDDVLNGGLRAGELLIIGGPFGVGKTIFGLQAARNAVATDPDCVAMYVCYEHDHAHLFSRLACLESAEQGMGDDALTLRTLGKMALSANGHQGLIATLRQDPRYAPVMQAMDRYAERLILIKASGSSSTLNQIEEWGAALATTSPRSLMVVDYLQKIPVDHSLLQPETEVTTHLTQGLKELAMSLGLRIIAIAAADRSGLKAKRMRLADLRGSSAIQYEADIGLILNNKFNIVSREHLVYNLAKAEAMRNWVVMSVEKNRAGRNAVDMEYLLDAAHFRLGVRGNYVRERLVDEKMILS